MSKVAVILYGWQPRMREPLMVCNLQLHQWGLILNRQHIRRRKPCQLPHWMNNSSYYSATAVIRTSHLPHSMTKTMGK